MTANGIDKYIKTLQQQIPEAKVEEQQTRALAESIEARIDTLHDSIAIHSGAPLSTLVQFVNDYIECVPEHLQALHSLADGAGVGPYVHPFLTLALTYCLTPPDTLQEQQGLYAMLCKAYLAHRIMEEVNDQVMSHGDVALAPMDMSMANIISHAIIGEDIANQLDHLVLLSIETTNVDTSVFDHSEVKHFFDERKLQGWGDVLERWPCFTKDCSVDLQFGA